MNTDIKSYHLSRIYGKIIGIITEETLGRTNHENEWASYEDRPAARAVITNTLSEVALMHVANGGYYKLPGGGIDEGESAVEALRRELKEEVGLDVLDEIAELGVVLEYREEWSRRGVHYCYAVEAGQEPGEPERTPKEIDEDYEVVWAKDIDHAIRLVESGSPKKYGQDFERARELEVLRYLRGGLGG